MSTILGLGICAVVHGQESWDATYVGGSKIGYTHTYVEKVKDPKGKDYLRVHRSRAQAEAGQGHLGHQDALWHNRDRRWPGATPRHPHSHR